MGSLTNTKITHQLSLGSYGKLDIPGKQYWTGLNNKDSKINKGVTTIKSEKTKKERR